MGLPHRGEAFRPPFFVIILHNTLFLLFNLFYCQLFLYRIILIQGEYRIHNGNLDRPLDVCKRFLNFLKYVIARGDMHLFSSRSVKLILLSALTISILSALYGVSTAQTVNTSIVTKYPGFTKYTLILTNDTLVQGNVESAFQGYGPDTILYDPQNGYIYVGEENSNMISVINPMNRSVVAIIKIHAGPSSMAYDPENGYLFVGTRYGPMVIINTHNNSVVSYDRSYYNIIGIIYDKQNGYLYAIDYNPGHHVHVICVLKFTNTFSVITSSFE